MTVSRSNVRMSLNEVTGDRVSMFEEFKDLFVCTVDRPRSEERD
jgi:hypothetical protein